MKFDDEICKGISCPECSFNKGEDGCLLAKRLDEIKIIPEPCEDAQPERTGKWIPCSERLPEEHIGFYLVTVQKMRITTLNVVGCDNTVHDIAIARWDYDRRAPQRGYHWCKADKVIAWMPLPEPYCPNCGARMEIDR